MIRWSRDDKGQDLVEYAIVFFLLFTLILGIIEFSIIIFTQNTLSNAAREGARFAVVRPHQAFIQSVTNQPCPGSNEIVVRVCERALAIPRKEPDLLVSVTPDAPNVIIKVSYNYNPFFGLIDALLPSLPLGSQSTMRLE